MKVNGSIESRLNEELNNNRHALGREKGKTCKLGVPGWLRPARDVVEWYEDERNIQHLNDIVMSTMV